MNALKYILVITLFFAAAISNNAEAQYTQQWTAVYDNGSTERIRGAVRDAQGNMYVTGASTDALTEFDIITIKYNSAGTQVWTARYTSPGSMTDEGYAIAVDAAGNVYVTGVTRTTQELIAIKYNSAGVQQWASEYSGSGGNRDVGIGIKVDNAGNVFVGGQTYSGSPTFFDFIAIKFSPMGVIEWAVKYDAFSGAEESLGMELDAAGNVYICGKSSAPGTGADMCVVKWNSSGAFQWANRNNGTSSQTDGATSMGIDASGNVFITGFCTNAGTSDITTIKYNSAGVQQWLAVYNNSGFSEDYAWDMTLDASGNCYVTGATSTHFSFDSANMVAIKYNTAGVQQWVSAYNGPGNSEDGSNTITVDASGNVYIAGSSKGNGTNADFTIVKYNASGAQQWVSRTNGTGNGNDIARKIFVDTGQNIYAAGVIVSTGDNNDGYTVKHSALTGIQVNTGEIPSSYSLSQNYPNPFNPITNFEFSIANSQSSIVNLTVYDISGKEVAVLVNEPLKAGVYKYYFDGTGLNSGVYFYRLEAGEFTETRKMMLVK